MNSYLSAKIRNLSFIAMIAVLYIHTDYSIEFTNKNWAAISSLLRSELLLFAVPLFFIISGYFFFVKAFKVGKSQLFTNMRKRIKTLLIPYLLHSSLHWLFFFGFLTLASLSPILSKVVNGQYELPPSSELASYLLRIYWTDPISYHLWYVRNLMILAVFSPIFFPFLNINKKKGILGLVLLFISAVLYEIIEEQGVHWDFGGQVLYSLPKSYFYFTIGGILACSSPIIRFLDAFIRRYRWYIYIFFLISLTIRISTKSTHLPMLPIPIHVLLFLYTLWLLYDDLVRGSRWTESSSIQTVTSLSFFIYLTHQPFMQFIEKAPLFISRNDYWLIVNSVLVPIVYLSICIFFALWFKRRWTAAYNLYSGGR